MLSLETPLTIIFFGPQGSGKGTQIALLEEHLRAVDPTRQVMNIQTGRRFRGLAARGEGYTETSLAETLDTGALQPLFLSVTLWGDAMRTHLTPNDHLLIDGFPRTVHEAAVLESALAFYKRENIVVVHLVTPDDVVCGRMQLRARPDDTPESIEARLRWYHADTKKLLDYYRDRANTHILNIDGTGTIEEIQENICAALKL